MDEDGHAPNGDLRTVIMDIFEKEIKPVLLKIYEDDRSMLKDSEGRIDRTNGMIQKLVDACKLVEAAYTSHVSSLQTSRDISQRNNAKLITANERMTRMMDTARTDYMKDRERLLEDLKSLKDEMHKATDKYWELMASYQRLAEDISRKKSSSRAEVKINHH
jgi:mRNA degradation ribonuclease J1/J2